MTDVCLMGPVIWVAVLLGIVALVWNAWGSAIAMDEWMPFLFGMLLYEFLRILVGC